MEFSRLNAPSLKELFIEQLENMILSGKLVIGEKLPSERELAESMHISRSVVNAGLAEIADKGFLEIIPRSGTYVADYHKKGKLDTLVSALTYATSFFVGILIASTASAALLNPATALGLHSWNGVYVLGPLVGGLVGVNLYTYIFASFPNKK